MHDLPVIQAGGPIYSCGGCGVCCTHVGEPPGFAVYFPRTGQQVQPQFRDTENHQIFERMPEGIKQKLQDYYSSVRRGQTRDRSRDDVACLWYDEQSQSCQNYEHRPTGCRTFEMGGEGCRLVRVYSGVKSP